MSDDIPPLMPVTPPPMTKLDWEDNEDFMDFPHLTSELPSESSLSPDGGWNPIDELPLPYDSTVIDKTVDPIKSNSNINSSDWSLNNVKNDQFMKPSISESELSLHPKNLSIWKDKENIVPKVNIEKITFNCDSVDASDCKTEIKGNESFDNVIDSYKKVVDDNTSISTKQHICDKENTDNNIVSQYSPSTELQLNNMELVESNDVFQSNSVLSPESGEILVNSHLEPVDIKESTYLTICVQNELLENFNNNVKDIDTKVNSSNSMYEIFDTNISINTNNNTLKKDQEEYTDFCDFETAVPNSINVPLPNRTPLENDSYKKDGENVVEKTQHVDLPLTSDQVVVTQFKNVADKCADSINVNCSAIQNGKNDEINIDNNLDSEFNDFCDFHTFSTSFNERRHTPVENNDDFCDFETSISVSGDTLELKQSNSEGITLFNRNDDEDNLKFKFNSKNNCEDDADVDDNFCDFESGYSTTSHQFLDTKHKNKVLFSEPQIQFDYKQFCKDAFQGDFDLSEEVDLQNLDHELNDSQVWQNLKDVESSPALNYNWSKSESNNVFLSSLSIDSRNILYGASWNPKVPRFAANMSNNPLEPLKACNNDATETKISQSFSNSPLQETVPDPEFDWKSSGLINPLDCNHTSLLDLELLDTLAPCCTNTLKPQTWKSSKIVNEELTEETPVQNNPKNVDLFNNFLNSPLSPLSDNQLVETNEGSNAIVTTESLEAQMILDSLPDFEVLQKSYLVILEKENNVFLI